MMDLNNVLKLLTKIEDIIKILEYIKIIPHGVPQSYEHIRNVFKSNIKALNGNVFSICDVAKVAQTLESILPKLENNPFSVNSESFKTTIQKEILKSDRLISFRL